MGTYSEIVGCKYLVGGAKAIPFGYHLIRDIEHLGKHLANAHGSEDGHEEPVSFVPIL